MINSRFVMHDLIRSLNSLIWREFTKTALPIILLVTVDALIQVSSVLQPLIWVANYAK